MNRWQIGGSKAVGWRLRGALSRASLTRRRGTQPETVSRLSATVANCAVNVTALVAEEALPYTRCLAAIDPGDTAALEALLPDRWLAAHPEHRLEQREEESREAQARRRRRRAARRIAVAQ